MEKKRSVSITILQLLFAITGVVGLVYLVALFIPASKVFFTDEADLGEALAACLFYLPLGIIISPVCVLCGIISIVFAAKQRKNEETKDVLSLIFLIIGIVLIVIPVLMFASVFIASKVRG